MGKEKRMCPIHNINLNGDGLCDKCLEKSNK